MPYKTLGIPEKIAKDGKGHWLTYGVQPSLTALRLNWTQPREGLVVDPKTIFCRTTPEGTFIVQNAEGQTLIQDPDFLAVIIIAHGASGGYSLDTGAVHPVTSTELHKITNAHRGDVFIVKPQQNTTPAVFDDIISFASRNNLMAQWAKFPCKKA